MDSKFGNINWENIHRIIAIFIAVIILCLSFDTTLVVHASSDSNQTALTYNGFNYSVEKTNNTIKILKYVGNETNVSVPSSIEGYPVTSIEDNAFEGTMAQMIVFPETITTMGTNIFRNCMMLRAITLMSETPPTLGLLALDSRQLYGLYKVTIYVQGDSLETYRSIGTWGSLYSNLIEEKPYTIGDNNDIYVEGGHSYQFIKSNGISWEQAKINCENLGGHLVTITTPRENFFLYLVKDKEEGYYWIGGKGSDNGFKWITNEDFSYIWLGVKGAKAEYDSNCYLSFCNSSFYSCWSAINENTPEKFNLNCYGYICEWDEVLDTKDYTQINDETKNIEMIAGEKRLLMLRLNDIYYSRDQINWTISNESGKNNVYIGINGIITGGEPGTATIRALKKDGALLKDLTITVIRNCDINNDLTINILDIASVAKQYNKNNKSSFWDNSIDINGDNIIDIYDLVIVARHVT